MVVVAVVPYLRHPSNVVSLLWRSLTHTYVPLLGAPCLQDLACGVFEGQPKEGNDHHHAEQSEDGELSELHVPSQQTAAVAAAQRAGRTLISEVPSADEGDGEDGDGGDSDDGGAASAGDGDAQLQRRTTAQEVHTSHAAAGASGRRSCDRSARVEDAQDLLPPGSGHAKKARVKK
jgi:hypothetical protein